MCGRYYFDIDEAELKKIIDDVQKNLYENFKTGEIYPTNSAPIIIEKENKISPIIGRWGFPKWDKKGVVINARVEGLSQKNMFKNLVKSNRCIVLASSFFEWKRSPSGTKLKDKYMFRRPDSVLYMAGLYNIFNDEREQLSMFDTQNENISYVIITMNANSYMSSIHDRMPLIFTKYEMEKWLHGENINALLDNSNVELIHSIIK